MGYQRHLPVMGGCLKPQTMPEAGMRWLTPLEACLTQQELLGTALTHVTPTESGSESSLMPRLPVQGERQCFH